MPICVRAWRSVSVRPAGRAELQAVRSDGSCSPQMRQQLRQQLRCETPVQRERLLASQ